MCFGVPLALLLLNQLGSAQDEARRTAHAREEASARPRLRRPCSLFDTPDLADLTTRVAALQSQITGIRGLPTGDTRDQAVAAFLSAFDGLLPSPSGRSRRSLGSLHRYSDEKMQVREWRTRVVDQWEILHREVRPNLPRGG
ncbi:hypothetical protein ACFZCP_41455 [Streptomyces sp. NPDC007971]|uniref:hypothetical protein n=1 Tax=Streptomyces sp. NPDC007971 TaxID=3364799 RepID=UPI0036E33CB5